MTPTACVIPVGPQFDDPEINYPPFVVSSDPGVGEIVTPSDDNARFITVTLADNNLGDVLYVRWLLDYPSSDPAAGQLLLVGDPLPTGKIARVPIRYMPDCSTILDHETHRLLLSVSDRKFREKGDGESVSPDAPRDSVAMGANRMRAVWILNCP